MQRTLHSANEQNDDLSEQCASAETTVRRQEATIAELRATKTAQENEIESLGTAYALKAQALEELQVAHQADTLYAEQTIASKDSQLHDQACEIAALKVRLSPWSRDLLENSRLVCVDQLILEAASTMVHVEQDNKASLDNELKSANERMAKQMVEIQMTKEALDSVTERERDLEKELAHMKLTWISAEDSRNLRKVAKDCQERELALSQRIVSLSADFCHLMERRDAVEKWRASVVALQQGLETVMTSICTLEKRCCEVQFCLHPGTLPRTKLMCTG
jgi:hypothetical protein